MSGKRPTKRSSQALKGQNATLDRYFSVKKIKHDENTTDTNTNENHNADPDKNKIKNNIITLTAKDDAKTKQQQLSASSPEQQKLPLKDRKAYTQKRQPLAVLSDTPHCVNIPPTNKPRLPAFVVLRDEEIDQGATEADQQQKSILPVNNTTQPTQEESPTQSVPIIDTQSSILTSLSSPVAIASQDSFFGDEDGGIEFRVDAFENDDTENEQTDNDDDDDDDGNDDRSAFFFDDEQPNNNNNNNNKIPAFFDDNEEEDEQNPLYLTKTYRRSYRRPTAATANSTQRNSSSDTEEETTIHQQQDDTTKKEWPLSDDATPTLEFSISNSLTIPLDIKANYVSEDDEESTPSSRQVSHLSTSTTSSPSPIRSIDQPTLPMSLSFDETTEVHVPYPFPRGKTITDKFGAATP